MMKSVRNKPLNITQEYENQFKHLQIIIEEQNPGYPRNHGIAQARGTFIMLMDQDDNLAYDTLLTFHNLAGDDSDVIIWKYADGKVYNCTHIPFKNGTSTKDVSIITGYILSTLESHKMQRRAMLNQYESPFCFEKDYYYWNQREDFGNPCKRAQGNVYWSTI